jgi:hypothetical protein
MFSVKVINKLCYEEIPLLIMEREVVLPSAREHYAYPYAVQHNAVNTV